MPSRREARASKARAAGTITVLLTWLSAAAGRSIEIAPGVQMPLLQLGTCTDAAPPAGSRCQHCCGTNLTASLPIWAARQLAAEGLVAVDTQIRYDQAKRVRAALDSLPVPLTRRQLWITTKVDPKQFCTAQDPTGAAMAMVRANLAALKVSYVDLLLLHEPCSGTGLLPADHAAWGALNQALQNGWARAIGVDRYSPEQMDGLRGERPAVLMAPMSVTQHDERLASYCAERSVHLNAFGTVRGCPQHDPTVVRLASKYNASGLQVCMVWTRQRGWSMAVGLGTNSSKIPSYASEDLDVFRFNMSAAEIDLLDHLGSDPAGPLEVAVDPSTSLASRRISPAFVGLSMEVPAALGLLGNHSPYSAVAQALRRLSELTPGNHEGPVLRIGGNSADKSCWYTVADEKCTYNISELDLSAYRNFASVLPELNLSYVLDTNLGLGPDPARGAAHIEAIGAASLWPAISAIEIGNECNLFGGKERIKPYTFGQYAREVGEYLASYRMAGMPSRRVQAAAFAVTSDLHQPWPINTDGPAALSQFLHNYSSDLQSLSYHSYSLSPSHGMPVCQASLLSPAATVGHAAVYRSVAAAAEQAGVALVIGEGNTVARGGTSNVSDVFASALWALDWLPLISKLGAVRQNFHGPGTYGPIASGSSGEAVIRPLFYGLLAFSEAVANHSSWVKSEISNPAGWNVAVHANVDNSGRVKVLAVAKDLNMTAALAVNLRIRATHMQGSSKPHATVVRLQSPGGASGKQGISWAGQMMGNDGKLRGNRAETRVEGQWQDGEVLFQLEVLPLSALLLTWTP